MKVAVVGTGYVGLTTAAILAHVGHDVICADVDAGKIGLLQSGGTPIFEAFLPEVLGAARARLRFTVDTVSAVASSDLIMLAVGTPSYPDGSTNLTQMDAAVEDVAQGLRRSRVGRHAPKVVVIKSTAPVGNARRVANRLTHLAPEIPFAVAVNPEFLPQGSAVRDSLYPDRIVVGSDSPRAIELLRELYQPILQQQVPAVPGLQAPPGREKAPFLAMDTASAELSKYAANAFLAMKISFINEIANVAELVGADVGAIAGVLAGDPRIGGHHLRAGVGYGGSCFPKDTRALHIMAGGSGYDFKLLKAVIEVNNQQWTWVSRKLQAELGRLEGKRIALLGLAFKPGTDDVRESLALTVGQALHEAGAVVTGYDPAAGQRAAAEAPWLQVCSSPEEAVAGAEAAVIVTDWPQFRQLDWAGLGRVMQNPLVLDGRRLLAGLKPEGIRLVMIGAGA